MNYKALREDTLKVIFKDIYYRKYIDLDIAEDVEIIKNYIDRQIVIMVLDDGKDKMNYDIFSTDIEQLQHPAFTINDYAKLYNVYRFIAKLYGNNFANKMQLMLGAIITDKMIQSNMLGQVRYDDYLNYSIRGDYNDIQSKSL